MPPEASVIRIGGPATGGAARVEKDAWRVLNAEEAAAEPSLGAILVPLASWHARRDAWLSRTAPVGVWLAPDDDPADIARDTALLPLLAIHFPKLGDGRGYSTAVLLRTRHGYCGELRAFGDIGRDQLFILRRCGFDAFALPPHKDAQAALDAFNDFSVRYQASVDEPLPLFRRRAASSSRQPHG